MIKYRCSRSIFWPAYVTIVVMLIGCTYAVAKSQRTVSNRLRYHAIPVALSWMYHGRTRDYTAHDNLAKRFQSASPLDELIAEYSKPGFEGAGTYLWLADDRGMADYVAMAFTAFRPRAKSLLYFYFTLLGISCACYLITWRGEPLALGLLIVLLAGLYATTTTFSLPDESSAWLKPFSVFESRTFEMLAMIPLSHILLLSICMPRRSFAAVVPTLMQVVLFAFLYHCRSSLGWQVLACGTFCLLAAIVALVKSNAKGWRESGLSLLRPATPVMLIAAGLACLALYQRATFNEQYFAEAGGRTFWHNAIMGVHHETKLARRLGIKGVDDGQAVDAVINYMREREDPRLSSEWTKRNALYSLGGYAKFDWAAYEIVARELYLSLWRTYPGEMLVNYVWYKPRYLFQVISGKWLVPPIMAPVCVVAGMLLLAWFVELRRMRTAIGNTLLCAAFFVPFSLIPAIAFYPRVQTVTGFLMLFSVTAYLGAGWATLAFWQLLFRRRMAVDVIPEEATVAAADLSSKTA